MVQIVSTGASELPAVVVMPPRFTQIERQGCQGHIYETKRVFGSFKHDPRNVARHVIGNVELLFVRRPADCLELHLEVPSTYSTISTMKIAAPTPKQPMQPSRNAFTLRAPPHLDAGTASILVRLASRACGHRPTSSPRDARPRPSALAHTVREHSDDRVRREIWIA